MKTQKPAAPPLKKVRVYSFRREATLPLSENFLAGEFACHDGTDEILVADALVEVLQAVRNYFVAPVQIVSGYRTAAHNRKVGGASQSQHLLGCAADIRVRRKTPLEVYRAIDGGWVPGADPYKLGLGLYGTFVHVDVRGHKSRWSA